MHPCRNFTTRALKHSEVLVLSINDLYVMKIEFIDEFNELFKNCKDNLMKGLNKQIKLNLESTNLTQS